MILNYDIDRLGELLKNFYELTRTRIVVFSDDYQKIAQHPEQDCAFCSLIRSSPQANEYCERSDRQACMAAKTKGRLYTYRCHAGLTESVAPVISGNLVIGYIMLGQVRLKEDTPDLPAIIREASTSFGLNRNLLEQAFANLKPVPSSQVYAASQILEACAGYLWLSRLVSLSEVSLPRQIDEHIAANLSADLSSGALCKLFGISRSRLYRMAVENYGMGIDQFVRNARIRLAKNLLASTSLPLSEIASEAGYGDYNYFIKVFKKNTGMTPRSYRGKQQV